MLVTRKTPNNLTFERRIKNNYSWMSGGYAHTSTECAPEANGHKMDATLASRMGGSNEFCE